MTENAFARAAAQAGGATAPQTDALTGNREGYDPLFGGEARPSLFIKTHPAGTTMTGILTDVPFGKQSRCYMRDGSIGALKFWGDDNKPTDQPTKADGTPRRAVMDEVFPLQTDYRDRSGADFEDTGKRAFYVGSKFAMDAVKKGIRAAGVTSREQLKGMRMTVTRSGEAGKWEYDVAFSRD